ncbi:MAG: hypothetical protein QNK19_16100 [Xanthomonadales bacterium]|nr:hypothetical protein [Xanthomonadales bacterium]
MREIYADGIMAVTINAPMSSVFAIWQRAVAETRMPIEAVWD